MMNPLVSIVVVAYNSEVFILETLNSIKEQTYSNIELIISDDCSKDDTVQVCKKWLDENRDRFIRTKIITIQNNTGIAANLNRGVKEANGEWIKGIAGDDLFFPNSIETYINEIKKDYKSERLFFHARVEVFLDGVPDHEKFGKYGEPATQRFNQEDTTPAEQFQILLRFCPVTAPTNFFHRSVFEQVGYFDERYKFWEDRPMWLKMTSKGIKIHFINSKVIQYRQHSDSVQNNKGEKLFSRTVISMTDAYKDLIIPHLPEKEKKLYSYQMLVRKYFIDKLKNKKTFLTNLSYKCLVFFVEKRINKIKNQYSP